MIMRLLADQGAKLNALDNLREVEWPILSRQWVRRASISGVVSALNCPPRMQRQGKLSQLELVFRGLGPC
jgi:hypothetical protein